jgi:deoxycytidylate deaminase
MEVRLKAAQRLGVGCRFFCERARKPVSDKDTGYNDCPTIHAEMMALVRAGDATVGATLYVNGAPCRQCAKLIAYCRIAQVVCSTSKAMSRQRFLDDTVRYLEAAGVKVWVLDEEA